MLMFWDHQNRVKLHEDLQILKEIFYWQQLEIILSSKFIHFLYATALIPSRCLVHICHLINSQITSATDLDMISHDRHIFAHSDVSLVFSWSVNLSHAYLQLAIKRGKGSIQLLKKDYRFERNKDKANKSTKSFS